MSQVNIGELRKYSKNMSGGTKKVIKLGDMNIQLTKNISLLDKIALASKVYNASVKTDNNTHIIDRSLYRVAYKINVIKTYTNIKLPEDGLDAYDLITNSGLYDLIYDEFSEIEKRELEEVIDGYISEKEETFKQESSVVNIVRGFVAELTDTFANMGDLSELMSAFQEDKGSE